MLIRKNYFLYDMDNETKELVGSVRFVKEGESWKLEIQWKENASYQWEKQDHVMLRWKDKEIQILTRDHNDEKETEDVEPDLKEAESEKPFFEVKESIARQEEHGEMMTFPFWEEIEQQCTRLEGCEELGISYRIGKGDFALLPEEIQRMLQNSFLIHGLMNYGYLLLYCTQGKQPRIGLGVPGIFYEKEKLVAEMFGFDGFWSPEKTECGKFGYYLRIVL